MLTFAIIQKKVVDEPGVYGWHRHVEEDAVQSVDGGWREALKAYEPDGKSDDGRFGGRSEGFVLEFL